MLFFLLTPKREAVSLIIGTSLLGAPEWSQPLWVTGLSLFGPQKGSLPLLLRLWSRLVIIPAAILFLNYFAKWASNFTCSHPPIWGRHICKKIRPVGVLAPAGWTVYKSINQSISIFRKFLLITNLNFSCCNPNIFLWFLQQRAQNSELILLGETLGVAVFLVQATKKRCGTCLGFIQTEIWPRSGFPCLFINCVKEVFFLLLPSSPSPVILTAS